MLAVRLHHRRFHHVRAHSIDANEVFGVLRKVSGSQWVHINGVALGHAYHSRFTAAGGSCVHDSQLLNPVY